MEDVTGEEFVAFMKMLSAMPAMTTMQGRKELVDIVAEQAELESPFDVRSKILNHSVHALKRYNMDVTMKTCNSTIVVKCTSNYVQF